MMQRRARLVSRTPLTRAESDLPLCVHESGCDGCGEPLPKYRRRWCTDECRHAWYIDHLWRFARPEAMRRAGGKCIGCGKWASEVDHIEARRGTPLSEHSCLHHQSNLRPLCHGCHVNRRLVFAEQRTPLTRKETT